MIPIRKISIFCLVQLLFTSALHAQWKQTNGLEGGTINCLVCSGSNLFAVTEYGGIYRSTNNGTSWSQVNSGLIEKHISSLVVCGTNIFAGTWEGVFLSTNDGESWDAVNSGLTTTAVHSLVASGTNLFAGTWGGGIFLSTDNGASWNAVNTGITDTDVRTLLAVGANIFAGTWGGEVFLSTNNGSDWKNISNGLTGFYVTSFAAIGANIFAGTMGRGILLWNGNIWEEIFAGATTALAVSGENLFAGKFGDGIYLSTNNGLTWKPVNNGLTSKYINSFAVNGSMIFAGSSGAGVFLSEDNGSSWQAVNSGLKSSFVKSFVKNETGLFAGCYGGGVFFSADNGVNWDPVNSGLTSLSIYTVVADRTNLFAGSHGYSEGIFLSRDNGANWEPANSGLTSPNVYILAVSGSYLFAGTFSGGVFLSNDNGTTWNAANSGLTNLDVYTLAVSGNNLFAGTGGGGVFLSNDNGANWNAVMENNYIYTLAANGTNLFAGAALGRVYFSNDNGATWKDISIGLTNTVVNTLVISETNLLAGTEGGGIYLSTDYGKSWTDVSTGLTSLYVHSFIISGENLLAGTRGGGVWQRPLSEMISPCIPSTENDPDNILENGNFGSCALSPWTLLLQDGLGASADVMISDGECTLYDIKPAKDPQSWYVQLLQELSASQLSKLETGATYTLSFDAYAETENRQCTFVLQQYESPYTTVYAYYALVGKEKKSYSFEFVLDQKFSKMKFSFDIGDVASWISFDDVKLKKKADAPPPCTPEAENDPGNILENGSFGSCTLSPWTFYVHDYLGASASSAIKNGECTVSDIVPVADPQPWHVQLLQEMSASQLGRLETGNTYSLTFNAYAETENRPFTVVLGQNESPYTSVFEKEFSAGKTKNAYSYDFVLDQKFSKMKISFDLGKSASPVTVDKVRLVKKGNTNPSALNEASTADVLLFPNPVTEQLTVIAGEGSTVRLYNCLGIKVEEVTLTGNRAVLDMTGLPDGVYLVEIRNRNGINIRKVVLQ